MDIKQIKVIIAQLESENDPSNSELLDFYRSKIKNATIAAMNLHL